VADEPTAPAQRKTRDDTKQAQLIAMLRRNEGATIAQIVAATGWQPHTVRGAFAGALKKKLGLTVTSEKVEGGERVYRIALHATGDTALSRCRFTKAARSGLYPKVGFSCEHARQDALPQGDIVALASAGTLEQLRTELSPQGIAASVHGRALAYRRKLLDKVVQNVVEKREISGIVGRCGRRFGLSHDQSPPLRRPGPGSNRPFSGDDRSIFRMVSRLRKVPAFTGSAAPEALLATS
jgi:hypothetical protein